ncbi:MAG TPA: response regulator [Aggregatilineales bacterium]|nr:response regulator [Aggregatilineales bacterium]
MLDTDVQVPALFEQQVRECLVRLYDYAFLQDHPIVQALAPDMLPAQRVQAFRQIVLDAIDQFQPDARMDFHSREARIYNILLLRYVEGHESQDVVQQLALSERQFYREHRRALQTVSRILWEQAQRGTVIPERSFDMPVPDDGFQDETTDSSSPSISVQSEVQRVFSHPETVHTDVNALLEGILSATRSLAERFGVLFELAPTTDMQVAKLDSSTLRQAIILILAWVLPRANSGIKLRLGGAIVEHRLEVVLSLIGELKDAETIPAALEGQELLQYLVEGLEGQLVFATPSKTQLEIRLSVPLKKDLVLVIDDNPDVVDLFKRYLIGQPYHVLSAPQLHEAIQLARDEQPSVVILDIMLPGKDGWEILQNLKNYPTTRHIPVLICSVMDVPDLAFSLGANGFLRKPPGRADFLTALTQGQA